MILSEALACHAEAWRRRMQKVVAPKTEPKK
jgi:hypothetical protein